jgi:hypothetical protein
VFVPGEPFQPRPVFVGKPYPRVEHMKGASLAPALPTNIRLGLKGLPGTNTLAYYGNPQITDVISFIGEVVVRRRTFCRQSLI